MSTDRDEFEQCVLACLEAPDDLAARTRRDTLLAAHPEWAADRAAIEALWRTAHLTAPGLDDTLAPDAPELPPEIEAQLLAAHPKPTAKPRHHLRLLFALAASVAVLLTLAFTLLPPWHSPSTLVFNRAGALVPPETEDAMVSYAHGVWQKVGPLPDDLDPALLAALRDLVGDHQTRPTAPTTRSSTDFEIWSPLAGVMGPYSAIRFYSVSGSEVILQLRSQFSDTVAWETRIPAAPPGPRVVYLPLDAPRRMIDLVLTPTANPLFETKVPLSVDEPGLTVIGDRYEMLRPSPPESEGEAAVAAFAFRQLFQQMRPTAVTIDVLLPIAEHSPAARDILHAIAAGYDLPYLAAYVDQLAPPPPD